MTTERFELSFLGANGTVTGSRHLLACGGARVLVDCGLFQGYKTLRLRNWAPFPVPPSSIDAVVLTHGHLDHSGFLPRLVRDGFRGQAWCSHATRALCRIMLPDSGRLQEEEAQYAARKGSSKHKPPQPLYSEAEALSSLTCLKGVDFGAEFEPVPGLRMRLQRQGHILGAAAVIARYGGRSIAFSGDLGRPADPVMLAPDPLPACDWIVCESTYGNRRHDASVLEDELRQVLQRVLARHGVVVVPAFAVGRAQVLLHAIARLQADGSVPMAPVYLNSPMAAEVGKLYRQFPDEHRLGPAALEALQSVAHVVGSVEESKRLNQRKGPMIIVSASGMATGGRVLHHLVAFAPDPRNAIVLSGFQAGGTRGASLAAGAPSIRIFGEDVKVGAEVVQLSAASAHADGNEILHWLGTAPARPRRVFFTHGEPDASEALRLRIERELHWDAHVPEYRETVDLLGA
jgi:metallo-beta-lactamase family protein